MKTLYLLRHAKAANPLGVGDEMRPLAEKGKQQATHVGRYLKHHHITPDLWISSAAKRTEETCKRVLRSMGIATTTKLDKNLYLASAGEMIHYLTHVTDNVQSILLVGHNPGIAELVMKLCVHGEPEAISALNKGYPPATLSEIRLDIEKWSQIEPDKGYLQSVFMG